MSIVLSRNVFLDCLLDFLLAVDFEKEGIAILPIPEIPELTNWLEEWSHALRMKNTTNYPRVEYVRRHYVIRCLPHFEGCRPISFLHGFVCDREMLIDPSVFGEIMAVLGERVGDEPSDDEYDSDDEDDDN